MKKQNYYDMHEGYTDCGRTRWQRSSSPGITSLRSMLLRIRPINEYYKYVGCEKVKGKSIGLIFQHSALENCYAYLTLTKSKISV